MGDRNISLLATGERFHTLVDTEAINIALVPPRITPAGPTITTGTTHVVVQQREMRYRFSPHYHPFVEPMMQRLLRGSTAALQAVDTENLREAVSLPFSIEVQCAEGTQWVLGPQSWIAITTTTPVIDSGGVPTDLDAGTQVRISAAGNGIVVGAGFATLDDGMTGTPLDGSVFTLEAPTSATLRRDATIRIDVDVPILLANDILATLPAGTIVTAFASTPIAMAAGVNLLVERSRPRPLLYRDLFTDTTYKPTDLVEKPYPVADLDFTPAGAYSVYNWEIFFHAPLTIAMHLSKNQRFAEAQSWFHYIFDPTDDSEGPEPDRFWKVRPFQYTDVKRIEELMTNLATGEDPSLFSETAQSITAWMDAPFRPHVIARFRQQAYMYKTVMAYLDNLIAWGDSLFRQDTGEAIDEAMMLYVLATQILGPKPQPVPRKGTVRTQTYANLRDDLATFGVVLRKLEPELLFDLAPRPSGRTDSSDRLATIDGLGRALYFCVPPNDKLLGYWDTVADRLFKIRNSLNLQGVFRQLALFEPPIDPGMLARAAAAGLDVGAIVNGLHQPLPLVRFQLLVQKAAEICLEVKSLGTSLLAAMEKEDGEAITLLRSRHERALQEMVERTRYAQVQEAGKAREGLYGSLALAIHRYTFYERQLGKQPDEIMKSIPGMDPLDRKTLQNMAFAAAEPGVAPRALAIDIAQDLGDSGGRIISSHEAQELEKLADAQDLQEIVQGIQLGGQAISLLPQFGIKFHFWGLGGDASYGGFNLGKIAQFAANVASALAQRDTYEAGNASRIGSFARRELDWAFQSNLAAGEITQIFKQIRAAEIREAIADLELQQHRKQMDQSAEIEHFLNEEGAAKKGKKTNKALYVWMKREVNGLYAQNFQFAFDIAKRAERALQHELGNMDLAFIQYGYLAGKEGLLAGEKLGLDIKRMELAYHELNQREYELTRHVSLLQIDPTELLTLRNTGECSFHLPEELFDMDGPGQYFRRIKTVAVSVPCVTGPYTGVNCRLSLTRSSIRITPNAESAYPRSAEGDDSRFSDSYGSVQSIVTSSGQNDSGLFETNLRDERYLPFEHAGVLSEWRLQLPANPAAGEPRAFDYATISDVILHIRYTAREGGDRLRSAAKDHLRTCFDAAVPPGTLGRMRLFSVRDEFPTEWAKFLRTTGNDEHPATLALTLRPEHYPFWAQDSLEDARLTRMDVYLGEDVDIDIALVKGAASIALVDSGSKIGKLTGYTCEPDLPALTGDGAPLTLTLTNKELTSLWIAFTWGT